MNLQVGVKAFLINKDKKILLLKRSEEKYMKYKATKGTWDIPGGRIEAGTPLVENLKREIKEETQLDLISEPRLIFAQDIIPGTDEHIVRLSFTAHIEGTPTLDTSENTDFKWLTVEEMKSMEGIDNYVKEIINNEKLCNELI